jgi:hypothetical protein
MTEDELAGSVVGTLSQYLMRKADTGVLVYDAQLENLLALLDGKLVDLYLAETLQRFKDNPTGASEMQTLRVHLAEQIGRDPEFGRQLYHILGGQMASQPPSRGRRKWRVVATLVLVLVLVGGGILAGRLFSPTSVASAPTTVTTIVQVTPTETATTTTETTTSSEDTLTPGDPSVDSGENPGDGRSIPEGQPVYLVDLPRPNDEWKYQNGDHDVQFTPYPNSLWYELATCNDSAHSSEQQFRLKNFSSIEVEAVGTDSKADPNLVVRFDVFANNDTVHPIASQVVSPGQTKKLTAKLPDDVFTLTLRTSIARNAVGSSCEVGNAVWGSPYVVAAGS